jgi:phosphoglycolate phosphatase-like HAD superfamily hydrolase
MTVHVFWNIDGTLLTTTRTGIFALEDASREVVLVNVRENLAALHARNDVINFLLTGNVREGAEAKLCYCGLWEFFEATVIGDTPHDISCGKVLGARTMAVATGPSYSLDQLRAYDLWLALEALAEAGEFLAIVGLEAAADV